MSAAEIIEQVRRLSPEEQREVFERLRDELEDFDKDLTPEQSAELDRRAENALRNPGRGTPVEQVHAEVRQRLLPRK